MVEINLILDSKSELSQEELSVIEIVEVAKASEGVFLNGQLEAPSPETLFESGEIGWESSPELERAKQPIQEFQSRLETFEKEICSCLKDEYFGTLSKQGCRLGQRFESYEQACIEAKELEESVDTLNHPTTITVYADAIPESIIKELESRYR